MTKLANAPLLATLLASAAYAQTNIGEQKTDPVLPFNVKQVIPSPDTRPDLAKPVLYWVPVIAPGNLMFYKGSVLPQFDGSALVTGLASNALVRITFDGEGGATAVQRWDLGKRLRDIEEAPDGTLWALEDGNPGGLLHLTPK